MKMKMKKKKKKERNQKGIRAFNCKFRNVKAFQSKDVKIPGKPSRNRRVGRSASWPFLVTKSARGPIMVQGIQFYILLRFDEYK